MLDVLLPGISAQGGADRRAAELADFMDSRAAFLAQKCIVEFCRVRAGVYWQKLFSEQEFQDGARSFPLAGLSRRAMPWSPKWSRARCAKRQACVSAACRPRSKSSPLASFAKYPVPAGSSASFWEDAAELTRQRLAATQAGAAAAGAGNSGSAGADGLRDGADPPRPADQRL